MCLNIGFIGAGKVGTTLGKYFSEAATISGYYSLYEKDAAAAAEFTQSWMYTTMEDITGECDVLFLTVPDGEIKHISEELFRYDIKGKTICHCSGAMSSEEAFCGIEDKGAYGYSIHPLFAVSDAFASYRELEGVFFTLESCNCSEDHESFKALKGMLEALNNPYKVISKNDKKLYHCGAAAASNLVCAVSDLALSLFEKCGFEKAEALKALSPIMTGNMKHIAEKGPMMALTGPVERNDTTTVSKHLSCLEGDEREIYRLLSSRLAVLGEKRHPDRDYAGMSELLGKEK